MSVIDRSGREKPKLGGRELEFVLLTTTSTWNLIQNFLLSLNFFPHRSPPYHIRFRSTRDPHETMVFYESKRPPRPSTLFCPSVPDLPPFGGSRPMLQTST